MLKQRVITALLMLMVLLPALLHPDPRVLGIIGLILIALSAWEWGRLNGFDFRASIYLGICTFICCFIFYAINILQYIDNRFWLLLGLFWLLITAYTIRGGQDQWLSINPVFRNLFGLIILCSSWLALYQAKIIGTSYLLSILLIVWVADISAYFVGRRWGKHKLAPSISPGKSWEGLIGGVIGVAVLSMIWIKLGNQYPDLQTGLFEQLNSRGLIVLIFSILFLTLMSVIGDLFESLMKRSSGAKDSSQLLPGHGGVLDRLDALLPVLPLSIMLTKLMSS